jgi:hypothetical protein
MILIHTVHKIRHKVVFHWHRFGYNSSKTITMKKIINAGILSIVAVFLSTGLFAQKDPAARMAEMKQKLITDLKMTDTQADSVVSINAALNPQRKEIFQDQTLSRDDKMTKMKVLTDEADKKIQPILGDPLFKQYQDWRAKNMQKHMGRPAEN